MSPSAELRSTSILFVAALEAEKRGLFEHSETIFARASRLNQKSGNALSGEFASMLLQFAEHCADSGRLEKAEALYREALSVLTTSRGADHLSTALTMRALADICRKEGKISEASELTNKARLVFAQLKQTGN